MSLNSFLTTDSTFENDDLFVRQGSFATYYNGMWYGMQSDLTVHESYQIKVQKPTTLIVRGTSGANEIDIVRGWNWISYLSDTPRDMSDVVHHSQLSNEDRFVTAGRLATFYDGMWHGSFTLRPGVGYRMYAQQDIDGFEYTQTNFPPLLPLASPGPPPPLPSPPLRPPLPAPPQALSPLLPYSLSRSFQIYTVENL